MERLSDRAIEIINELHTERLDYESEYLPLIDCADKCRAYEDTGLEPEEIISATDMAKIACALHELNAYKELGPIDRLHELAQADLEGKVPRYTIGDTVYDRRGEPWQVVSAELHSMRTKNEWLYRCGHEGTDDYRALWHFEAFPSREAALRREQDG